MVACTVPFFEMGGVLLVTCLVVTSQRVGSSREAERRRSESEANTCALQGALPLVVKRPTITNSTTVDRRLFTSEWRPVSGIPFWVQGRRLLQLHDALLGRGTACFHLRRRVAGAGGLPFRASLDPAQHNMNTLEIQHVP